MATNSPIQGQIGAVYLVATISLKVRLPLYMHVERNDLISRKLKKFANKGTRWLNA